MIEHYITDNIKKYHSRHIIAPILLLLLVIFLIMTAPFFSVFMPKDISLGVDSIEEYEKHHVSITSEKLYSTHYDVYSGNMQTGTFYYTFVDDKCLFVLLPISMTNNNSPVLENITISGKLTTDSSLHASLMTTLAEDIKFGNAKLNELCYSAHLNVSGFSELIDMFFSLVCLLSIGFALYSIVIDIISMLNPVMSPPVQRLKRYGNPEELLKMADEELSTLPQLATEDMFITEHFFIEVSYYGITIVPIKEIIWLYKNSTLKKRFGIHMNISYTLHTTANKNFYVNCPKNIKSDIDGIIDYLAEANHDILVGFNEKNKRIARIRSRSKEN